MKLLTELYQLYELKPSVRSWHIPLLAALCVGLPLLGGYIAGDTKSGSMASLAGLVILYMPDSSFTKRMITLMACSFGFVVSFLGGLLFGFNPFAAASFLGLFTFGVHWTARFFKLKPPANFFFIMLAAVAVCSPFNLKDVIYKTGLITIGCIIACMLAFFYGLIYRNKNIAQEEAIVFKRNIYIGIAESAIFGFFIGLSFFLSYVLNLHNAYWVPVSCLAVMQGVSKKHVLQRTLQRISGTFFGLGLAYLLLKLKLPVWGICLGIMFMQFVVEMLITRNYAIAVIFITSLTLLLAEFGSAIAGRPNELVVARFIDIVLGSAIGAIGGYFVYHQKIKESVARQFRKTRIMIKR